MQNENRKYYPFDEAGDIEAIVIHCSDPRWRKVFEEFLEQELNLKHYGLLAIPGSVSAISVEMAMPKRFKALRDYVEFMVQHGKKPRLIVINHQGCRMYGSLARFFRQAVEHQQRLDLDRAAKLFKKLFPALVGVEVYIAKIEASDQNQKQAYFEKIAEL